MSLWTRIANVLKGGNRLNRELDAEMESHIEDAVAAGRDPSEARRAFGGQLQMRESSRDFRIVPWLDALRSDAIFGWRQLIKNRVTSAAAILSLALAIGSCTSAFRLIDALLLRPLPVANPEQLYAVSRYGPGLVDDKAATFDGWTHPAFEQLRAAVKDQAELIAISYLARTDLTYGTDQDIEKAQLQYVSGSMFRSFGLHSALGRVLSDADDGEPGAHPYAVLSYDYWTRRFGRDATVLGRACHIGGTVFEIIGVGPVGFTGTETGAVTDIFVPTAMHPQVGSADTTWQRTLARIRPEASPDFVRAKLDAVSMAIERERTNRFKGWSKESIDHYLVQSVRLESASAGFSGLQQEYRRSLTALGVLVVLVLLIACANVANLMTAQAASRAREMALRVSIGAGRLRLVQLVLVESAWISSLSVLLGSALAWWTAPLVVSMINARLSLPWDARVFGFSLILALTVTILFGLTPALRASSIQPASALKGGDDPRRRRRSMHTLIAAQVAFCFVVLFVAGLFATSFERLSNRPTGFSSDHLLALDTVSQSPQPPLVWNQIAERLQSVPGVQKAAIMSWPLLVGYGWNSFISVNGQPPAKTLTYLLSVSPGWLDTMKIRLIDGRDLRASDTVRQAAIVNEAFARQFFNGENPVGKSFATTSAWAPTITIVGLVGDAVYRDLREPILPVAYVPLLATGTSKTIVIRSAGGNPLTLVPSLREELRRARPDFQISNIRTQEEINRAQTVRERLLTTLALFFAIVAVLLGGIGLYGVLDYSVLERRREIGIRIAIGAPARNIARVVMIESLIAVILGAVAGLAAGLGSTRYIESLLYEVKSTDLAMLAIPAVTILAAALLAAVPAILRAIRVDPVKMLRSE